MTCLLLLSDHKDDHVVRPHSLKVTTISAIMEEIVKGSANLPHLAIQGNCRAAAAQNMGKVYSRNLAQRGIFASKFAREASWENQTTEPLTTELPEFSEKTQGVVNLYTPKL